MKPLDETARELLSDIESDCFIHGYGGDCIDGAKAIPVILQALTTAHAAGFAEAREMASEYAKNYGGRKTRKKLMRHANQRKTSKLVTSLKISGGIGALQPQPETQAGGE